MAYAPEERYLDSVVRGVIGFLSIFDSETQDKSKEGSCSVCETINVDVYVNVLKKYCVYTLSDVEKMCNHSGSLVEVLRNVKKELIDKLPNLELAEVYSAYKNGKISQDSLITFLKHLVWCFENYEDYDYYYGDNENSNEGDEDEENELNECLREVTIDTIEHSPHFEEDFYIKIK